MKALLHDGVGQVKRQTQAPDAIDSLREASDCLHSVAQQTSETMKEVLSLALVCQYALRASIRLSLFARDETVSKPELDNLAEALHRDALRGLASVRRLSCGTKEVLSSIAQTHNLLSDCANGLSEMAVDLQREHALAEREMNAQPAARIASSARHLNDLLDAAWPRQSKVGQ